MTRRVAPGKEQTKTVVLDSARGGGASMGCSGVACNGGGWTTALGERQGGERVLSASQVS